MKDRLSVLTGSPDHNCDSFAKWLALAIHSNDSTLSDWAGTKAKCDGAYALIRPRTGFMRLCVGPCSVGANMVAGLQGT